MVQISMNSKETKIAFLAKKYITKNNQYMNSI